jgi:hypothetical protein
MLARADTEAEARHRTGHLFNAMIAPMIPLSCRGVIWYQGESNVNRAYQYRRLFPSSGDWAAIRSGWELEERGPRHRIDLLAYGHALLATEGQAPERIGPIVESLRRVSPTEAEGLQALAAERRGDLAAAAGHFEAALRGARTDPWIQEGALATWLRTTVRLAGLNRAFAQRIFGLLEEPFAAGLADQRRKLTRVQLAPLVSPAACVDAWAAYEPWVPWTDWSLEARAACYEANGHPLASRARRDLARWRSHQPPRLEAGLVEPERE